jgi:DNA-binding transcriptional LysR family regulator
MDSSNCEVRLKYSASVQLPDPPLPDLSIRQLEYLVAVDESATWATAAATVGVSPSALSQGLAELERRLGVRLFDRDGRRRHIRATAAPVVAHARQVLGLTNDLARWADRIERGATGRVRLGMIDAAAIVHFPDELQAFRVAQPGVELLLRVAPSAQLLDLLVAGQLDAVVCVAPAHAPDGIDIVPLRCEDLAVYSTPASKVGRPAEWGPWVLYPTGSHTREVVVAELRRLGAPLDVVAESHQPDVLREMVRLGVGWTVLPRSQAEHGDRPLAAGRALTTRQLIAATRAGAVHDPAVDLLLQRFRSDPSV